MKGARDVRKGLGSTIVIDERVYSLELYMRNPLFKNKKMHKQLPSHYSLSSYHFDERVHIRRLIHEVHQILKINIVRKEEKREQE